jgi:hypothetical protein
MEEREQLAKAEELRANLRKLLDHHVAQNGGHVHYLRPCTYCLRGEEAIDGLNAWIKELRAARPEKEG